MEPTDLELLRAWTERRDAAAFTTLYARYAGLVYGVCLRILRESGDAEDVAQECFLELARSGQRVTTSVPAWLHRLATHRALDRIRGRKRRLERESRYAAGQPDYETMTWRDIEEHIDAAIAALPPRERELLLARYFHGETEAALGARFGLARGQVRYRLEKAIEGVRRTLRKRGIPVVGVWLQGVLATHLADGPVVPATLNSAAAKMAVSGIAPVSGGVISLALAALAKPAIAAAVVAAVGIGAAWVVADRGATVPDIEVSTGQSPVVDAAEPSPVAAVAAAVDSGPAADLAETPTLELSIYFVSTGDTFGKGAPAPTGLGGVIQSLEADHGVTGLKVARAVTVNCPAGHGGELSYLMVGGAEKQFGPVTYPKDATSETRKAAMAGVNAERKNWQPPIVAGDKLGPQTLLVRLGAVEYEAATGDIVVSNFVAGVETPVQAENGSVSRIALGHRAERLTLENGVFVVLEKAEATPEQAQRPGAEPFIAQNPLFLVLRVRAASK